MVFSCDDKKFNKQIKILEEKFPIELVNAFRIFRKAFVEFKDIVEANGGHTQFGYDENVYMGEDGQDLCISVLCFKGTQVQVYVYSALEVSLYKKGTEKCLIVNILCKNFNYFCNI